MDDEFWMTAQEAADHFGVKLFTIYSWVRRGQLQVGGLDERGRKVFRLLDVALVEKATRTKAKRVLVPAA
jgi:predicted site-specific integrase-resolvase